MIYAMSDIHGQYELMEKRIEQLKPLLSDGSSKLILLGDYIDRGNKSYECLKLAYDLEQEFGKDKIIVLKGNHEVWFEEFLFMNEDVWLAEEKKSAEVVKMVTSLSDFFRTTLSKGHDYITVKEERTHIESYLEIQQFRYQDILDYEIQMDEEIYGYIIPKLTLKPLVENALYHGIKNKRGKGKILITGKKQGDKIIFQVIDNGKGMTEEELNSLRKKMAGTDTGDEAKGFGVSNVYQRI